MNPLTQISPMRAMVALLVMGSVAAAGTTAAVSEPSAPSPRDDSTQLQERVNDLYMTFAGSVYERDAAGVVQAYALNEAMDTCMQREGFPDWDWSLPRSKNPPSVGFRFSVFFSPPMSNAHSTTLMATAPAIQADHDALAAEIPAGQRASIDACSHRVDEVSAASTPAGALRLKEEWWSFLAELDAKYGDAQRYRECLASTDFGALGRIGSTDEGEMALYELNPGPNLLPTTPDDPRTQSSPWTELVAAESQWDEGEFACRYEVYNQHLASAVADAQAFVDSHVQEIAEARAAWNQVVARAEELGYDGRYVSVDAKR